MTAQTWHVDRPLAERYASGQAGDLLSASIEQHLVRCSTCRDQVGVYADPQRHERVWTGVLERVQAPRMGWPERVLRACGFEDSTARLLALTPSLRGSWLTGVLFILVLAQLAANSSSAGIALYMALAPVLPVISVAAAFGGEMDPSREMAGAAPYPVTRLLLLRTAAVVTATLLPAAALAFLVPGSTLLALGWLLPSLALSGSLLAMTPRVPALPAAVVLTTGWMSVVGVGWMRHQDPFLAASLPVQLLSTATLVAALALFLLRQETVGEEIRRAS